MKRILLYILATILIFSCKCKKEISYSEPIFKDIRNVSYNRINTDMILSSHEIYVFDSLLLLVGESVENDLAFHFINKQTGKYLLSFGNYGNGPGELARPTPSFGVDIDKKQVWAFNSNFPKVVEFIFGYDSLNHYKVQDIPIFQSSQNAFYYWKLKENRYVVSYIKTEGKNFRFTIGNNIDTISTYNEYPRLEKIENNNAEKSYFRHYSSFIVKPDGQKLVSASRYGGIIEIFDIKDNKLNLKVLHRYYKPMYTVKNQDSKYPFVIPSKDAIQGFRKLRCTNDAIYIGLNSTANSYSTFSICKFDWEGNPICQYKLDKSVNSFDIDTKHNRVYAIITDCNTLEYELVWFGL